MSFAHLSLYFMLGSLALFAVALRVRRVRLRDIAPAAGLTLAVLLVLTAVFDNVMIGSGLFDYNNQALLGIRVGLAPLEDFSYPFCAALVVPALWWLAGGAPAGGTPEPGTLPGTGREC
ncbi:lycopene cyclase domain-containing protein [Paeniglutamicibacter sp. ABSL32-1]|uniref:lycopene cyclase domain-containing protein n=1 Tax=Paeniglutamicibacter quisquiliarum TaxID=2849498 RepID=UPI001C2CD920|nr:lycopene cyclase domain-containing protein [Paeniglutamicibacter quisquiliarum]MBV1777818.1 lycopene cyclase domain-containing protein [Paeniglutamicibacter quisquiliarum]